MVRHSEETSSDANQSLLKGVLLPSMPAISVPKVGGSVLVPFSFFYNSGVGNRRFDVNWNSTLPSIPPLPQYLDGENSDIFILPGADNLAPELHEGYFDGKQE